MSIVETTDGADVERALKAAHERLCLRGYGWSFAGRAGQTLEHSIVDRTVGRAQRLVFEGPPLVAPPLKQDAAIRRPEVHHGARIDASAIFKPLTANEVHDLARWRAAEERRIAPEKRRRRAEFIAEEARKLAERRPGMTIEAARAVIEKQANGLLTPSIVLVFDDDDVGAKTVADVLDRPDEFAGLTLADPLEGPAAGRNKAAILHRRRRSAVGSQLLAAWPNDLSLHGTTPRR